MRDLLGRTSDYGPSTAPGQGPRYAQVVYLTAPAAPSSCARAIHCPAASAQDRGPRTAVRGCPVSIWSWLKLTAALWLLGEVVKGIGWLLLAALAVTAWPLTVVAGAGYLAGWLRGWPPARLWRAACWSLPITAVYAIGEAIRLRAWPAIALAPMDDYGHAWRLVAAVGIVRAGLLVAPVAVPAGLAIGGVLWA